MVKCLVFVALLALTRAAGVHHSVTGVMQPLLSNPQYSYSYGVNDPITGDSKSQMETRNGDFVQGQYSLVNPDGTQRIVDYSADSVNGFNAVVSKVPVTRVAAAPLIAAIRPVVPTLTTHKISPITYSVPSTQISKLSATPLQYNIPYGSGFGYARGLVHPRIYDYGSLNRLRNYLY